VCVVNTGKGDASKPAGSDEVEFANKSMKDVENRKLGRYEVYD
jgi:hypothetical protein